MPAAPQPSCVKISRSIDPDWIALADPAFMRGFFFGTMRWRIRLALFEASLDQGQAPESLRTLVFADKIAPGPETGVSVRVPLEEGKVDPFRSTVQ